MSKVGASGSGHVGANTWDECSGSEDRLRACQEDLKKLSSEMKVSQICESAGFMRKVSIGQDLRTTYDVDDGFEE